MEARKNYVDEKQFKSQAHLLILANDMPECQPADCLETCLHMPFPTKFVKADDPDYYERIGQPGFLAQDNDIKDLCKKSDVLDAFTHAVCCKFWTKGVVTMPSALQDTHREFIKQDDTKSQVLDLFHFTGQDTDCLVFLKCNV